MNSYPCLSRPYIVEYSHHGYRVAFDMAQTTPFKRVLNTDQGQHEYYLLAEQGTEANEGFHLRRRQSWQKSEPCHTIRPASQVELKFSARNITIKRDSC